MLRGSMRAPVDGTRAAPGDGNRDGDARPPPRATVPPGTPPPPAQTPQPERTQLDHVVQVVQEFSQRGGIESVAFELERAWKAAGVSTSVIACSVPQETSARTQRVLPWLAGLGTRGRWRYVGRALAMPAFSVASTLAIRRLRARGTVVISHGDSFAGDVCVVHAVNKASLVAKTAAGDRRWMLNPMHAWVGLRDRVMIGGLRFRRYVALSERVARELEEHYAVPGDRISVIPNGVNLERFSPMPDDRADTRRALGIPADAPLLLFVGHEFERKGLAFVLEALALLGPEVRLVVVGAGNVESFSRVARERAVDGRVVFTGPRRDLPQLYRAADAFVFPTFYEAFPLVCMEAMACGLPLFGTRVGGVEEYLEDGINGHAIERDGRRIADILRPVLADPALLRRLRRGALETASGYSWEAIARRYLDLVEEVSRERAA